ncbi:MAG: nucleoside triphosphate pyrophosphohydrolase [Methylocystaceae bacterium]|jgi:MazG family protein|nr:nucleoside triphosphate pyrophosphohydrolase [Methylocystaceae bacterium]NBT96410.1 nucleoside triphosphate pyrophosphohydrolase [Methylocystaceae bacterium]
MSHAINRLIEIMATLRTPITGCPWDLEQNFSSIAPYTLEEAYEVVDAIERNDMGDLREELGDLLLQVVFHARMAEEKNCFDFNDVIDAICEKLIRRHPHVFGEQDGLTSEAVLRQWDDIKAEEKRLKQIGQPSSLLDGVPLAFSALTRAVKLQKKASKVGFDWNNALLVIEKVREETEEVAEELKTHASLPTPQLEEEIGDLLFVISNLARHVNVDPEQALRGANRKFERRFHYIEARLNEKTRTPAEATLSEMELLWLEAKKSEK